MNGRKRLAKQAMKEKHPISQEERIAVTAIHDPCSSTWWLDKTVTDMLTDNAEVEIKGIGLLKKLFSQACSTILPILFARLGSKSF